MSYRFSNYADLKAVYTLGMHYHIRHHTGAREDVLIMAPHGRKIEDPSSVIAEQIAGQDYAFYAFEGNLKNGNLKELHIPSEQFDEPIALTAVAKADLVVAIHGRSDLGDGETIWMGGLDVPGRHAIGSALVLAGFKVDGDPPRFKGQHPLNICNRGKRKQGVQLEIPKSLRESFEAKTATQMRFVTAIRQALAALLK